MFILWLHLEVAGLLVTKIIFFRSIGPTTPPPGNFFSLSSVKPQLHPQATVKCIQRRVNAADGEQEEAAGSVFPSELFVTGWAQYCLSNAEIKIKQKY